MSQNPPDQPELPKLPDFPSGDANPAPADQPPADPDPQPFDPSAETRGAAAAGEPPASPPPTSFSDIDGGSGGGGSKAPLILGGLVALLVVGGLIWWVTKGDSSDAPDKTVRDYLTATEDGDCDKLITLVTEEMWSLGGEMKRDEAVKECEAQVESAPEMELKVDKVKTTSKKGDNAVVEATIEISGRKETLEIDLRKVDGDWLIDEM